MAQSMGGGGVTAAPRTFGILSIVFSSLVLVGSLFGLVGLVVPVLLEHATPTTTQDAQAMATLSAMYRGIGLISVILTVMSGALLALGIGQLRYRRWAAAWTVRWGVVALGAVVVMAILTARMSSSAFGSLAALGDANGAQAGRAVGGMLGGAYAAMTAVFYSPYPILLMIFFSRERVRAAMTA